MTVRKSFKRLARMEKTGESYTAARASLLGGGERAPAEMAAPVLATSDAAIRERTGRGWEEWFDLLDDRGAAGLRHREIARRVAGELGSDPLAWNVQAITLSYERARGGCAVGQREDGFAVSASRTVSVPVARLRAAWTDPGERARWLPAADLRDRGATSPRSARFDWGDGPGRVAVTFDARGDGRSTCTVEHGRLADAAEAEAMRAWWRERLTALKAGLEEGGDRA